MEGPLMDVVSVLFKQQLNLLIQEMGDLHGFDSDQCVALQMASRRMDALEKEALRPKTQEEFEKLILCDPIGNAFYTQGKIHGSALNSPVSGLEELRKQVNQWYYNESFWAAKGSKVSIGGKQMLKHVLDEIDRHLSAQGAAAGDKEGK